ncbi:sRNA-binding protein [Arthrobacter sp. JUb119]|nr:sRNA-binding protein [Arthrobacter sp. JUb119]
MATQPKKEPTEAELYAAEEKARVEAIEAQKAKDEDEAAKAKSEPKPGVKAPDAKAASKPAANRRAPAKAKPKERVEVYEQRGPKGLFKVTRNIDTGETTADLIED